MSKRGFKSRFTKYIDHDISYPCAVEKAKPCLQAETQIILNFQTLKTKPESETLRARTVTSID